ncbi:MULTISPECIES: hypothetical protein [Bradyrhizobium]|uniref:hypothetical protein n=1 Tax=Bradyrhizobium TaxID=374 RepID=UPI0012BC631C|nr:MULTISPECIES: hypothetical protein [Bradyrhizobium]MCS3445266.1 hypothetical protein [Bradyrhizobium elkanii]MCS3563603.1 hypothetical protein [Bradyrhizobium elkanii]MCW2146562.1 hypothetical protein [Bradyrhizobium elkanii]MCW2354362.1 hypothetical protein [Bradyrhizobium elkanii]MCW2379392.1 hypothetical protein [Bradyrhizobium elkanii]
MARIPEKLVLKQGAMATILAGPQRDHALTPILTIPQGKTAHGLFILQCSNYLIG